VFEGMPDGVHVIWSATVRHDAAAAAAEQHHAEYASTLHQVLVGLESASLAAWKLGSLLAGYLGLLLFTVYLSSSEVRLPIVQYSKAPPPVSGIGD
jgi:preprotein translocase subunit SecY